MECFGMGTGNYGKIPVLAGKSAGKFRYGQWEVTEIFERRNNAWKFSVVGMGTQ